MNKSRRRFITHSAALLGALPGVAFADDFSTDIQVLQVWKSATCGCCEKWVNYMETAGFTVEAFNVPDVNVYKSLYDVPTRLASCHTALISGYAVEGHVPASDVKRLLAEQPEIACIAVPGMPLGSPGMESPNPEAYSVFSFTADGEITEYSRHEPPYSYTYS